MERTELEKLDSEIFQLLRDRKCTVKDGLIIGMSLIRCVTDSLPQPSKSIELERCAEYFKKAAEECFFNESIEQE